MDPYRSKPSVAFMPSASNATFHGGNYTVAGVINDHHTNQINLSGITPMELLLAHCALDALVNSNERYDPPKCAPHTRDPVMEKIITWTNKPYRGPSVLWLSGSAGAGKTAICQTVAEQFLMKRLLLGSFFFSRTGATSESGRSDGDRLIPTLVYQLFQAFPETKQFIEEEIRRDPALLHKSRQYQMAVLFENSLTSFSWRKAMRQIFGKKVRLIVIDGLDECQDTSVQRDLLRIISSTATNLSLPLRFLIASRPEGHITQSFKRYFKGVDIHHIQLDDEPSARIGIMTFLQDGFRDIHEHHPLQQNLETSWPGESVLSLLADKSSPQFVYASTVMKYVQSTKHLPSARLDAILNISYPPQPYTEDDPFDELDRLYRFIFSGIEGRDRPTVNCCLSIIYLAGREDFTVPLPTPSLFEGLFGLHPGGARIMLEPLLAVLAVPSEPDTPVQSHHAHLFEFLLNPHRSGTSVLDLTIANTLILKHYCSSPFSEYLGEASLFALKGMIHHAEMICITPDSRGFVDRLFVALFSKVLWYTQDQGIVEKFEILDDAFTILSQIQSTRNADFDLWLPERLRHYQACLPNVKPPASIPFSSVLLQTKHCIFVKLAIHHYPPGSTKSEFLTTYNERAVGQNFGNLIPFLHMATAFAFNSQVMEWFDFIYSVGFMICDKTMDSDTDVELVLGCRSVILEALDLEQSERNDNHTKALRLWSGIKIEGRYVLPWVEKTKSRKKKVGFAEDA